MKRKYIYQVKTEEIKTDSNEMTIKDVLQHLILKHGNKECCPEYMNLEKNIKKYLVIHFLNPAQITILLNESLWGRNLKYVSHVEQKRDQEVKCVFFQNENKMMYQNQKGDIHESTFRTHKNVTILTIIFDEDHMELNSETQENLIYGNQTQLHLRKKIFLLSAQSSMKRNGLFRKKKRNQEIKLEIKLMKGKKCTPKQIKLEIKLKRGK